MRPGITRYISSFLIFVVMLFFYAIQAEASELSINARAAILMDADTGQVYFSKDADKLRSPASLTKLMTAIIAVENGNLDDIVEVRKRAASIYVGSTIGLREGDKITLDNLLRAALICSANDSTVAIAEHVGGSHDAFVYQMNRKAILLGAVNTRFMNTNGYFDPNHNTTAYDLGLITRYALEKPQINELVSTRESTIKWVEPEREKEVRNTNRLLFMDEVEGINGVKTGSTARAGNCLIASATRGDTSLIAVVLHAGNRYREAAKLLNYGFEEIKSVTIFPAGRIMGDVEVKKGTETSVAVTVADPVKVKVAGDQLKNIKLKVKLGKAPQAPVREGQLLGYAIFNIDGYRLSKVPLVAVKEIPPSGLLARTLYWFSK